MSAARPGQPGGARFARFPLCFLSARCHKTPLYNVDRNVETNVTSNVKSLGGSDRSLRKESRQQNQIHLPGVPGQCLGKAGHPSHMRRLR